MTIFDGVTCCHCGVQFGMTRAHIEAREDDGGLFYCPNGHELVYREGRKDRELKKLRRTTKRQARELERHRANDLALTEDLRVAREQAKDYPGAAQRGAFWRGYEDRRCGRDVEFCPYPDNRFGFRRAWLRGFGVEDLEAVL